MKLRNRASLMTQLPEGSAPVSFWSRITQGSYQLVVVTVAIYLLYLLILQFIYFRGPGQVEVKRTLLSAAQAGQVSKLHVSERQQVLKGAPLLRIDPNDSCDQATFDRRGGKLRENLQLAKLEQRQLDQKVVYLRQTLEGQRVWRALELGNRAANSTGSIAEELDYLLLKYKGAGDLVHLQQELLDDWRKEQLNQPSECSPFLVVAPFDATVVAAHLGEHEYAARGEPLVTLIATPADVIIEMQVDEEDMEHFALGDEITVELPNGITTRGRVSRLLSNAYPAARRQQKDYRPVETLTRIDLRPLTDGDAELWQQFDRTDVTVIARR